jgi:hypothetical protein
MQAFGAYASASVDLAGFAPPRRSQRSHRSERSREPVRGTARGLLASIRRALTGLGDERTPKLPRLNAYPY